MDEQKIAETRKDASEILHELALRHPGAASWIRTIRGYLMESLDALAEAQETVERLNVIAGDNFAKAVEYQEEAERLALELAEARKALDSQFVLGYLGRWG